MKYVSLFSGIEAASVAWKPLGWEPVAFSEIAPFPSAVLAHHHPDTPNLGDMTQVDWSKYRDAADVVCGGSPCQSFSVAGLRRGLSDPRGNLALEYLRAVDAVRPKWVVWENVPGVLSSGGGRDFGTFLGALAQLGYGWAYRVMDAQYVRVESHPRAVPQRRRRVWVVGCLGDWRGAAAVLLERESMCGHPAPRRETGQAAPTLPSRDSGGGFGGGDFAYDGGLIPEVARTLTHRHDSSPCADRGMDIVAFDTTNITSAWNASNPQPGDPCHTIAAGAHPPAIATRYAVRRLTPRECERLQGFPDDYTLVPYRGKPACDGPRYKALGNSWAVNAAAWVGQRIQEAS